MGLPGLGPNRGPNANLPRNIAVFVAVLGALAGFIAALNPPACYAFVTSMFQFVRTPSVANEQKFETAFNAVLKQLLIKPPDVDNLRQTIGVAYDTAAKPEWKCRVVNVVINTGDQTLSLKIAPVGIYEDYQHADLPKRCAEELRTLAKMIEASDTFGPFVQGSSSDAPAQTAQDDKRITHLKIAADAIVAQQTPLGTTGWVYVGRTDPTGQLTLSRIIAEDRAKGRVTTLHDMSIRSAAPSSPETVSGTVVGRIPAGSKLSVISVKQVTQRVASGSPGSYLWALVSLVFRGPGETRVTAVSHRTRVRAVHAWPRFVAYVAPCPLYPETNSLHGPTQRWIYVGQKVDGSDEFLAQTSHLDTQCVPRDGAVARVTQRAKVFVGRDPHWPGVTPTGQVVVAGTNVQVVGDVAGYGFDASDDPTFCDRDPQPRQRDPRIQSGHEKRYCVYIPFNPI